jgi:hypothetical protein
MKPIFHHIALVVLALTSTVATAQFVKGNEAVRILPNGNKQVETPPTGHALLAKPCPATEPGCSGGGWKMVETQDGLMECTEVYARPSTCKASTFGSEKRLRVWVVKTGTEWKHCESPSLSKGCVSLKSLPNPKVQ